MFEIQIFFESRLLIHNDLKPSNITYIKLEESVSYTLSY